jgi:ATP-dependent Zn protease
MDMAIETKSQPTVAASTAYHEAGHAVCAWRLRMKIRKATVISNEYSAGRVQIGKMSKASLSDIELGTRFSTGRIQAEKQVMVAMAGAVAQRKFAPRSWRSYHDSADHEIISDLLERYAGFDDDGVLDARQHYKLLRQWTEQLIRNDWKLVEAVAEALMERGTLSGDQVRQVILTALGMTEISLPIEPPPDALPEGVSY